MKAIKYIKIFLVTTLLKKTNSNLFFRWIFFLRTPFRTVWITHDFDAVFCTSDRNANELNYTFVKALKIMHCHSEGENDKCNNKTLCFAFFKIHEHINILVNVERGHTSTARTFMMYYIIVNETRKQVLRILHLFPWDTKTDES